MNKTKVKFTKNGKKFLIMTSLLSIILLVGLVCIKLQGYIEHNNSAIQTSQDLKIEADEKLQEDNQNSIEEVQKQKEQEMIANAPAMNEEADKKKNDEEYEKLKKEKKIPEGTDPYYIKVNYGAQTVTVYTRDSSGKYTVPVRAMICSTGTYTPTSGVYRTLAKGNWWGLYGDVYGQYATHIVNGILFHSVPYLRSGDRSSLEYWAYDQLGSRVSMGCVRLTVADAKWIYDNCKIGTQVEFYSSSDPGPLGKPSARRISNAPKNVRGWDPTDPNKDNPWPEYLKSLEKKEQNNNKQTTNNNSSNNNNNNNSSSNNNNNNNNNNNDNNSNNTINVNTVTETNSEIPQVNTTIEENNEILENEIEDNNIDVNEIQNDII